MALSKKAKIGIGVGFGVAALAVAFFVIKSKSVPDLKTFNWQSESGGTGFVNSGYYPETTDGKTVVLIENGSVRSDIVGTLIGNTINWSNGAAWTKI